MLALYYAFLAFALVQCRQVPRAGADADHPLLLAALNGKSVGDSVCKDDPTAQCDKLKANCGSASPQIQNLLNGLCPFSCHYCGCYDTATDCASLKAQGFCEKADQDTKFVKCRSTCGLCNVCIDPASDCEFRKSHQAFCADSNTSIWEKKQDCAKTCGFC